MATKKRTKRKPGRVFWLTRNIAGLGYYHLWNLRQRPKMDDGYGCWREGGGSMGYFEPNDITRYLESGARLKRGGGPIKVRITIEAEG